MNVLKLGNGVNFFLHFVFFIVSYKKEENLVLLVGVFHMNTTMVIFRAVCCFWKNIYTMEQLVGVHFSVWLLLFNMVVKLLIV